MTRQEGWRHDALHHRLEQAGELAVIDAETGELFTPSNPVTLFGTDDPHEVVVRSKAYADELAKIIAARGLYRTISGKAYVFVEAWSLLGSMLGVFAVSEDVVPVEIDGVKGFKATVKAVTRQGEEVGRATAYCMRDEPTWSGRTLHAVAGMAETRATSRALRKPLGFIVQLAGYEATASEEMPPGSGAQGQAASPSKLSPPPKPSQPVTLPGEEDLPDALKSDPSTADWKITQPQMKRLWTIKDQRGMPDEVFRELLEEITGQGSTKEIRRAEYRTVSERVETWEPEE